MYSKFAFYIIIVGWNRCFVMESFPATINTGIAMKVIVVWRNIVMKLGLTRFNLFKTETKRIFGIKDKDKLSHETSSFSDVPSFFPPKKLHHLVTRCRNVPRRVRPLSVMHCTRQHVWVSLWFKLSVEPRLCTCSDWVDVAAPLSSAVFSQR